MNIKDTKEVLDKIWAAWCGWDINDFSRSVYGDMYERVLPSRQKYLLGKFQIWKENPMKLYPYLDIANQKRLARSLNLRVLTIK